MMDAGKTLALVLLYVVVAGYAVLMLRIFVQILCRAAIERRRRQQSTEKNGGSYTPRAFVGKSGWANTWLPRNPEIVQPAQSGNSDGKRPGTAPIIKRAIALISVVIAFGLACSGAAQSRTGREVTAATLKQQLLDLELQEMPIRMRLEEVDELLKPESVERELAGIGSVHPEELREHRRKLLTIERNGLQTQLDLLEEDRERIEAAIAGAATRLEYAQPSPSPLVVTAPAPPTTEMISLRDLRIAELPLQRLSVAVAMVVLLGGGFILVLIVATQKVQHWIVAGKSGSSGFPSDTSTPIKTSLLKNTQGVRS